jgi:hypothetical protein
MFLGVKLHGKASDISIQALGSDVNRRGAERNSMKGSVAGGNTIGAGEIT